MSLLYDFTVFSWILQIAFLEMSGTLLATCDTSAEVAGVTSPLHWRVAGINITYMAVGTLVYFLIAVIADYALSSSWFRALVFRTSQSSTLATTPSKAARALDDDVIAEQQRVLTGLDINQDALSLKVGMHGTVP